MSTLSKRSFAPSAAQAFLLAHRRQGVGRRLVAEVIAAARRRFHILRLRTENPGAARFYENLGFQRAAGAGDCTHVMELGGTT